MITLIDNLPPHVIGLLGEGEITAADYEHVVLPSITQATADGHHVSVLYVLSDGAHYDAAAVWEDAKFGIDHMSGIDRIAVVTDDGRLHAVVKLFGVFMPGRVRVYGHQRQADAEDWLSSSPQ